ncbi:MAG TPA: GLUG motif-containing protein [Dehalococcoidia bacterium]|nr:GLUG motif-containing protein [Dehalococcoidia bacterium]
MKRVSIFLITAALIAGMAGCGPIQYNLTISSTEGGEVTTPGEGTFAYDEGTVGNLVAEADEGYRFVSWTGDVDTIADVNAAATNITMNGHYSITANFAIAIEIWDWYDLDAVRDNLAGNYTLMNDLDSNTAGYEELASPTADGGMGWEPIGTEDNAFTGSLDGQGHEIRDLFINRPDEITIGPIGLFGFVNEGGIIKSVGVVNASVTGYIFVGSLVGANVGTVSNSYFTGSVTGTGNGMFGSTVGGLLGWNGGAVSNSYSTGSVIGEAAIGGLVGVNGYSALGTVSNSYANSNVTGVDDVGGLVGVNGGTVSNSYANGNVTGVDDVGGLVGFSDGTVSDSFWDTQTSGQATSDGGTGKNTTEMKYITTFSGAGWNIIEVGGPGERNPAYIWNIVNEVTYPFLSWQPV